MEQQKTGRPAANLAEKNRMAENQIDKLEKKASYFKWMLDEYAGNAYVSDLETYELLYLNKTSYETLGLPPEKVLGHKCYEMIQGRTSPCPFCTNDDLTEDEFYEWEFYNPVLHRTYLLKDRLIDWEGHRARLELSYDNLSSEYKLEKKEREKEALVRTIPGGFARIDARDMHTVLWYGGGFLQLIGYTEEQFENELHSQSAYVHPDDMERAIEIMKQAKDSGVDTIAEGRIVTRDGHIKILTMTFSYVSGENSWDGIESFYSVGIDITKDREEQERQKKMLEDAYQTARVANSAKTNFLSSMSHNIRTPMNAIMGMVTIAQANLDSPEKTSDCLNKINTASQHLLNLINEVLDMSKIESGKIDLALNRVDLTDFLQSITDICQPLIAEKQQQFQIDSKKIRHRNVITDEDRLQQVLMNLLSNAIKYTPDKGKITLTVKELYSPIPGKSRYEFICSDNGIGISKEFIPSVFEPFTRAEDPRISKRQGTGLGMTITENIVRMMNGTIAVESQLGVGSTFTVAIPLELCKEEIASEAGIMLKSSEEDKRTDLSGKKILLAEDNDINREIAVELLQMHHINVYAVENGRLAREAFEASAPGEYSAILMDIQMPVLNGYEATEEIRSLQRSDAQTVPIIALTADAFISDVSKARNTGMNDHVAKPIQINRLLEVLQKWIV